MIFQPQTREKGETEPDIIRGAARAIKGIPKCFLPHLLCIWLC